MGGMQGGSVASQLAVQTILETVALAEKKANPTSVLIQAIKNANSAIIEHGQKIRIYEEWAQRRQCCC